METMILEYFAYSIVQLLTLAKLKYFRHHCLKIAHDLSPGFHQLQSKLWATSDKSGAEEFFKVVYKDSWESHWY